MPPLTAIGSSAVFLLLSICQFFIPLKSHSPLIAPAVTQTADEWRSLFNGKDLSGWHTFGKTTVNPSWKVADGCIYYDAASKTAEERKGPGDLVTNDEFENFHLELEWKVCKNGNSGIIFWSKDNSQFKESWHTGPEMQVLDNDGHPDGKILKHRAGNLYDLLASKEGVAKPYEQWNKAEIIADHGLLIFRLNNEEVLRTRYDDENWKALIAGSKFKTKKDFGTFTKGHIVLQDHGDNVWYRNIRIKSL
jgi:hypothetical protein